MATDDMYNDSKFKCIVKWIAHISVNRRKFYSKVYEKLEDAAAARKALEEQHWVGR